MDSDVVTPIEAPEPPIAEEAQIAVDSTKGQATRARKRRKKRGVRNRVMKPAKEPRPSASGQTRAFVRHRSRDERCAEGKSLRDKCPRTSHAAWKAPAGRPTPIETLLAAENGRMPELLPLRHGRMLASPFTFYRGSALAMAMDLAATPVSGIRVQCCGDAHLCNFGGFATPERRVIFSINDLDETLPAPWEWDVKRLAASIVIACRDNGLSDAVATDVVFACVRSYRERMAEFSAMKTMDLWYFSITADMLVASIPDPKVRQRLVKRLQKESTRSIAEDIFPKLAETTGKQMIIKDQLPAIFHVKGHTPGEIAQAVADALVLYRDSLAPAYQVLLDRFELKDAAIKVVGVGSVGTRCWVLLFAAGEGDPFFLQVKEARPSVLEPSAGKSAYPNEGQRIVNGYRIMQPYSDIFLGWTKSVLGVHFFIRQLRDMKISALVENFRELEMTLYARWCAYALALAHARSGDPSMISGYLGKGDTFDKALAKFSVAYADQNEKDHAALTRAVRAGKIKAVAEQKR